MPSLTIFIVEDKVSSMRVARLAAEQLAERLGRELVTLLAATGAEAVGVLRERPQVDLVLLDIHMPSPDVDGRLLVTLIRNTLPGVPILAYTGDRTDAMAADLAELQLGKPVLKPIGPEELAERMYEALSQPSTPTPLPLQGVLANHLLEVAPLIEQRGTTRPLRLALLARDHLARLGLERILNDARQMLPVDILAASGNRDAVLVSVQQGAIDLLVASPDAVEGAQAISSAYGTPVLIYARASEAGEVLDRPFSLVVGPTTNEEVATAITQTIQGVTYRDPSVVALLKLTPRHREILRRLNQGASAQQLAEALRISEDRIRHILVEIYDLLKLPHSRAALNTWLQSAPLHLFEQ